MKWMLVVMALDTTPIQTGLVFDSLDACYAAEQKMAEEYVKYYNDWIARYKKEYPTPPAMMTQRLMRGICVPHGKSN